MQEKETYQCMKESSEEDMDTSSESMTKESENEKEVPQVKKKKEKKMKKKQHAISVTKQQEIKKMRLHFGGKKIQATYTEDEN